MFFFKISFILLELGAWGGGKEQKLNQTYVWIHVERFILNQRLSHMHNLRQHEYILKAMRDLFRNELDEIRHELMEAWVLLQARKRREPVLFVQFVQECSAHFLEVEL